MAFRRKNNRLEPEGHKKERLGGLLRGLEGDEAVTVEQLANYLGGDLVTDTGAFGNLNSDQAIRINSRNGFVYIPIIVYP